MYVPAVAVGKLHEYAVVGRENPEVSMLGTTVVHTMALPLGVVMVHDIEPAGSGFPIVPETIAVRVVTPPSVGELDAESEMDGTKVEIPRVTEFEFTAE